MARGPRYRVPPRRRREHRTSYYKRLALLKSGLPRFVVRKTDRRVICQVIQYDERGDRTVAHAVSPELREFGYVGHLRNTPAAYLTGYLCGLRAIESGVETCVLDMGLQRSTRGNRVYAALRGAVDAGLHIPHNADILPDDERISGAHISEEMPGNVDEVKNAINQRFGKE